jgi:hypothetical protein
MTPEGHPNWGGARQPSGGRPRKSESERYSLARAINSALNRERLDGYEAEISEELAAANRDNPLVHGLQFGGKGVSVSVPFSAFSQRVIQITPPGTGGALFGETPRAELGVLQWSAVANSGATIIENLCENFVLTSEAALPQVTWTAEAGAIADADLRVLGAGASPHRISGQTILSKQLSVQTGGGADALIARSIARALSAAIDQTALYGLGDGIEPRGVLHTPGVNNLPIAASGDWWGHLGAMRRVCLADDAEFSEYGVIFSPGCEQLFHETPIFANASHSILMALPWPHQISNQIDDERVFSGCWPYECLLFWGGGVDLLVDGITRAVNALVTITASVYADTVCRFPTAFSYTQADSVVVPPPFRENAKSERKRRSR